MEKNPGLVLTGGVYTLLTTVAFWPNDRLSILVSSSPFRSANLFRSLTLFFRRSPVHGRLPAAWKRSGTGANRACAAAHCARATRLISIRVGTLGGASQFLPVFARVTIDRRFNAPWPCFRASLSATRFPGEIKRSPLGREKTTGSVRWLNRDGRFVIPSLFFFFLSVKCSCVSRQSNSIVEKCHSDSGFWLLPFFTRMNDSTISVGILYRFLDERWTRFFADIGLSWGVSLSVKTCPSPSTRTISLSYPVHESWTTIREVNRENVTKDDSSFSIDSCKQFVTLWKITFIISSALLSFQYFQSKFVSFVYSFH